MNLCARTSVFLAASSLALAANGYTATDVADIGRGKNIFVKYCSGCHGAQGHGDGYRLLGATPANLVSPATKEQSDEELIRTIHEGKPNMPVWKYKLSRQDSEDVLAYIRSLPTERKE